LRGSRRSDEPAPRTVREAISLVPGLGRVLGDTMLVATELVTNAVRHSLCQGDEQLDVRLQRQRNRLRISVRDPGNSGRRAEVAEHPGPAGGLGLMIVSQLACAWGSERLRQGYEVWAEVSLAG
jgi:two-component sensor histidine kinase